ncbi:MAG: indole-3-glycerol-phosphate synthase [Deltaproteobacteria bacterium]|jgi:indole-3-glycerol phosphate synthase|nr:indole-3-glycerol-phosphate synthase [Deltaproteobacteria bacterium]
MGQAVIGQEGLARFRKAKAEEIARLKAHPPSLPAPLARPDFLASLKLGQKARGLAVIAEYKRASPSLGDLKLTLEPLAAAKAYAKADAISVLTEETYFKGSLAYLKEIAQNLKPTLRKDFIFIPEQVMETAGTLAAAVLLIVRLTPETQFLASLIDLAQSYALTPVVEVFNLEELAVARAAGAKVIQVNARDLATLKVDKDGPINLITQNPPQKGEFWIAASGLSSAYDLVKVQKAGFGAALLGSALMKAESPQEALASLLAGLASL